ncbi:transcription factor Tfb4 [Exidia glandulosa HHB12029]|uniref:General transcription and DNA repair factor IIH subunit TFB4 n=1 Tax=Exidia glandulosa HHB12029 TaxID=1314781 RepID=A0A165E7I6_EXIGL|nr:transcription factor Tfb4 [Exidia glandulosa HHB12029]
MDRPSHLALILDLSPTQWHLCAHAPAHPLSLRDFLAQTLAFVNSHLAAKHENSLVVLGALPGKSAVFYPSEDVKPRSRPIADANTYQPFRTVDSAVMSRIMDEFDALGLPAEEEPTALVGAITKALCLINRLAHPASSDLTPPETRVLIVSVSPDLSTSYIPLMNSIFSAQKLKTAIDVCKIFGPDAVFLQQAAHLTGGSYVYLEQREALLQYLVMSFLPAPSLRSVLSVPTQEKIDFRAACFCHKNIIDVGYVCSVCLSIFCTPVPVCSTCRTKFPISTIRRLKASVPSSLVNGSAPATPRSSSPAPIPSPLRNGTDNAPIRPTPLRQSSHT